MRCGYGREDAGVGGARGRADRGAAECVRWWACVSGRRRLAWEWAWAWALTPPTIKPKGKVQAGALVQVGEGSRVPVPGRVEGDRERGGGEGYTKVGGR